MHWISITQIEFTSKTASGYIFTNPICEKYWVQINKLYIDWIQTKLNKTNILDTHIPYLMDKLLLSQENYHK